MGIVKRRIQYEDMLFRRRFNNPLKNISLIMSPDFSDDEFYDAFKKYYPNLWEDTCNRFEIRKQFNARRKAKGKSTFYIHTPDNYLKEVSKSHIHRTRKAHSSGNILTETEIATLKEKLERKAKSKVEQRRRKQEENDLSVQLVCPKYINKLIQDYFSIRKQNTLDVNARYLILLEISQFKCSETITFLNKINACDKNNELRRLAFQILQQFGEQPRLARDRKGKQTQSMTKYVDLLKNPTELLQFISENQNKIYQRYDVFLSHSSLDKSELLRLKRLLNKDGLVVYIDWVNDKIMLNRKNQNDDTFKVLSKRMEMSSIMLLVLTDHSIKSESVQWEVEYFNQRKKTILTYQPNELSEVIPENFDKLISCKLTNEDLICEACIEHIEKISNK